MTPGGLSEKHLAPVVLALGQAREAPVDFRKEQGHWVCDEFAAAYAGVSPWAMDRSRTILGLEAVASELHAKGEAFLREAQTHPWLAPFAADRQGWVDCSGVLPSRRPTKEQFAVPHGEWPSPGSPKPAPGALWTSSLLPDSSLGQWPDLCRALPSGVIWRLSFPESVRVKEIRGVQDWAGLVRRYPRKVSSRPLRLTPDVVVRAPLYGVDWAAVGRDWDAVRFPLDGLARLAFVEVRVMDGITAWLTGYGLEETLWLRWRVEQAEPLATSP
jgi:hypothetical protein